MKIFEQVKAIFAENHAEFEVWETSYAGHAVELARKAVREGYENVIAVGGDGTVLEVATGLNGSECCMGVIPAGTGNDFVRSLGIATDGEQAAHTILQNHIRKVDMARTEEENYFMNVAGCGFDTEVVRCTEKFKSAFKGQLAYLLGLLNALIGYRCVRAKIDIDGKIIEQKVFLVAVANGQTYGGGMNVAPQADVADGLLDITVVDAVSGFTVLRILPKFIKGKHDEIKQIHSYRGKQVRIECEKELPINMDGELIGHVPMSFEILPAALNMFVNRAD